LVAELEARLRLALGESLIRLGETADGQALSVQAADLAERVGANDLLARAALVYGIELSIGMLDGQMISLLRRALARFDEADSPLRARLMTRLAAALTPSISPEVASEILGLMRSATAMARRIGDQP
jgi:hypothetical protein